MIEIAVQDLNKYYGSNHVIKGISFEIFRGEKVGLIGRNGSGKTTLFKVLSGEETYESGNVMRASGTRIEVLQQIPVFEEGYTVENVLHTAFEELFSIMKEMRVLEIKIQDAHSQTCSGNETAEKLLNRYGKLQTQYEALGGYEFDSRIDIICNGMKIGEEMRLKQFSDLSGGEQTRVNLARILLRDADILLLDEPTNHLDLGSLQWVEEFLKEFSGTIVVISHDRSFLDNVVTRIIEIEEGQLGFYEGNYSNYAVEKERRFQQQQELYEQQQKKIGQLEAAAKRMHEWARNADNPAMHKRAFSIEKRIERMDRVNKPVETKMITAEFKESGFSSEDMVLFRDVGKGYGNKTLFHGASLSIQRNDRIALIGENGCGKTTLIRILTGEESADRGEVRTGNSVKMAYLPQVISYADGDANILDTVRYELEISEEKARRILASYHFTGKDVLKKTGALSGGEKSRLKLCLLMQNDINLLVLDEPTNHLDIPSREWIEEAVSGFDGTILFISHDRYFINKFTSRVWEMKDGGITNYSGTFEEYCQWKAKAESSGTAFQPVGSKTSAVGAGRRIDRKNESRENESDRIRQKETGVEGNRVQVDNTEGNKAVRPQKINPYKEMKKAAALRDLENDITEIEERLKALDADIYEAACDFVRLNALYQEKAEIERSLDSLYQKWSEWNEVG